MLNKFDDYPIHQSAEPLAMPATSDVNFYDRTWFNGYAKDGSWYFGLGLAVYPHLGILDCAFSVVERVVVSIASSVPAGRHRSVAKPAVAHSASRWWSRCASTVWCSTITRPVLAAT